jgi:PAS domain S-box-containing protein
MMSADVSLALRLNHAPAALRYALAVMLFSLALWARFALIGVLPDTGFPFLTFFPAVLLAAFFAGLGPGLLTSALSIVAAWYFFIGDPSSFDALSGSQAVALAFFSAILGVSCIVIQVMNLALGRARRAEERVRADEQRLRRVLDNLFVHVAILDRKGIVREVNKAPLQLAQLPREQVLGTPFWQIAWFGADRDQQEAARSAVLRAGDGERVRYDAQIRGADGKTVTVDLQVAPMREPDGRIAGVVLSAVDVSARLAALTELERSRAQAQQAAASAETERRLLDATLDAVPAGIMFADATGRLLRMNRANQEVWGPAPLAASVDGYAEWKGWWADGSERHGKRIQPHEWGLARALRGERCTDLVEIEPFGQPAVRRLLLLSAAPVRDASGAVLGGVVAQVDITAQIIAERRVQDSELKFRALAENIPQLAWMGDAQGELNWYNPRWFAYTGTTLNEMQGSGWRKVHHPDHVERVTQIFRQHVERGEPWEDTFPLRRHDGSYRWFLTRAIPLRDAQGRVAGWVGTNTDVTDQIEVERALRDSEDRLLAREAALREADRQKDTFLATLAHELRNPLAPIRAATTVIKMAGSGDPRVLKMSEVIDRQSAQLARLVDDLLDVSRITFGNVNMKRRPQDLRGVVDSAMETIRPQQHCAELEVKVHLPPQPVMVDVDETRIAQCVANLVNNACKFTKAPGRIDIEVGTIDDSADDAVAVVRVRDTGLGISPAMMDKLFQLFAQERRSGMGGNTGLGIGLALTRKLVELHGGEVRASSDGPGKGALFEIRLPLANGADRVRAAPREPAGAHVAKLLVVDDNADTVETLATLLELRGYSVFTATDGASALASVRAHQPRLILLDIGLPDMSGYDVARQIRAHLGLPVQPVLIALTGWGQDDDRRRAVDAGFDEHLTKPADPAALSALLDRYLAPTSGRKAGARIPARAEVN